MAVRATCMEVRTIAHAGEITLDSNAKVSVQCAVSPNTSHRCANQQLSSGRNDLVGFIITGDM